MAYSLPTRPRTRPFSALSVALLLASPLLVACGGEGDASDGAPADSSAAVVDSTAAPATARTADDDGPKSGLAPNELGEILILEYHRLGEPEGEFVRKAENFQKDLDSLYAAGFRPVTMRQVIEGNIDIPAGTSPVVFTIDDSSRGQFYYRPDGSIDPGTIVGMWEAFQKKNPAWHNGAVWCVLPAAGPPSNFFSEKPDREFASREEREANIRKKMTYLIENRHEICNHTLYHARLDQASSDAQAQEWIGRGEDSIKVYLPADYDIVTFCLPLGMWPKTRSLAWRGTWAGRPGQNRPVSYEYEAVLEVSGDANPSPFDTEYDPHAVDRFIVGPGRLERQLAAYRRNPSARYVSDGDPNVISVPQELASRVDRNRWKGKEVRVVQATPAPAGADSAPR